jgi:hypothetical protein
MRSATRRSARWLAKATPDTHRTTPCSPRTRDAELQLDAHAGQQRREHVLHVVG